MVQQPSAPSSCAAIVLAAGASTRLRQPKQLLLFQGEPLIRRAARLALAAGAFPVFVIVPPQPVHTFATGSATENEPLSRGCIEALAGLPVAILANPEADSGMGSSLRRGMAALADIQPQPARLLLMVCDQPFLRLDQIRLLLDAQSIAPSGIAAAAFTPAGELSPRSGVPAVFSRDHFSAVATATGDQGARILLRTHSIATVPIPEAAIDIDTIEDLRFL